MFPTTPTKGDGAAAAAFPAPTPVKIVDNRNKTLRIAASNILFQLKTFYADNHSLASWQQPIEQQVLNALNTHYKNWQAGTVFSQQCLDFCGKLKVKHLDRLAVTEAFTLPWYAGIQALLAEVERQKITSETLFTRPPQPNIFISVYNDHLLPLWQLIETAEKQGLAKTKSDTLKLLIHQCIAQLFNVLFDEYNDEDNHQAARELIAWVQKRVDEICKPQQRKPAYTQEFIGHLKEQFKNQAANNEEQIRKDWSRFKIFFKTDELWDRYRFEQQQDVSSAHINLFLANFVAEGHKPLINFLVTQNGLSSIWNIINGQIGMNYQYNPHDRLDIGIDQLRNYFYIANEGHYIKIYFCFLIKRITLGKPSAEIKPAIPATLICSLDNTKFGPETISNVEFFVLNDFYQVTSEGLGILLNAKVPEQKTLVDVLKEYS